MTPTPDAAVRAAVPPLSRAEKFLLGFAAVFGVGVGGIGLVASFATVTAAGARWGFATPQTLPIGIDTAIPVFTVVNLLLIRMDMPLAWVRWVPWALTGVTCWLNIAAGQSMVAKLAHGTMPLLWVVLSEVAAHVYASRIGAVTGRRMDKIRRSRWILAPLSTFTLWRRMTLWEITSYDTALTRERDRQLARADLRETYGRRWRRSTPRRTRVLLKLGELAPAAPPAIDQTANQDQTAATSVNQSGYDLPESTPTPAAPVVDASAGSVPTAAPTEVEAVADRSGLPVVALATTTAAPRRATGRVPAAARTPRPRRTADQLLLEAREVTAGWEDDALTGEAIRRALRTAPDKARVLRETLKAERAAVGAPAS
ncbi:DUF2637 domain-containing protein [Actinacidiphila oryziradicis]|uniref:DUF2637 domain-containing protein n=1 Tax=Actinacidiphila oryziradicis TaxID=2571141 RepID=A0A4U0SMU2_9ACTN|nr:DUF2637 domain-containing protein [Actinacidiphila oryziradicis]TKA09521.1 DUF2637 domain-containing protein [Actinacidiphila oryziradicis]